MPGSGAHFNPPSAAPVLPRFSLPPIPQPYTPWRMAGLCTLILRSISAVVTGWSTHMHQSHSFILLCWHVLDKSLTARTSRHFINCRHVKSYSLVAKECANLLQPQRNNDHAFRNSSYVERLALPEAFLLPRGNICYLVPHQHLLLV